MKKTPEFTLTKTQKMI